MQYQESINIREIGNRSNFPTSVHPVQKEMWNRGDVCTRYENFASHQPYISVIDTLLDLVGDIYDDDILELGCGVASATEKMRKAKSIIATDVSETVIRHSSNKLREDQNIVFREKEAIEAVLDYSRCSSLIVAVNCIHLFENLDYILKSAYQEMPDGGAFAFSTGLTRDATLAEESVSFAKAVLSMRKEARKESNQRIDRANPHPPLKLREEYRFICEKAGFVVTQWEVQRVKQTLPMLSDFLLLPGIIEDLTKVKVEGSKREALADVAINQLRESGLDGIQRDWLHVVVEKL